MRPRRRLKRGDCLYGAARIDCLVEEFPLAKANEAFGKLHSQFLGDTDSNTNFRDHRINVEEDSQVPGCHYDGMIQHYGHGNEEV